MTTGRRLPPEARRAQLLDAGEVAFAAHPYEAVQMAELATTAGVSRALLYRYFPTKRDLFAAVYQRAADRLVATAADLADLPLDQMVVAGLDAHIDFFVANTRTVLVANRGPLAGDPVIEAIIAGQLTALRGQLLDLSGLAGAEREVAALALYGWLAFVRAICVDWLADPRIDRTELRDLCLRTLLSALAPAGGGS